MIDSKYNWLRLVNREDNKIFHEANEKKKFKRYFLVVVVWTKTTIHIFRL